MTDRTYSTLISNVKGKPRLQQLVDWVGGRDYDGPIVLDECHKGEGRKGGQVAVEGGARGRGGGALAGRVACTLAATPV